QLLRVGPGHPAGAVVHPGRDRPAGAPDARRRRPGAGGGAPRPGLAYRGAGPRRRARGRGLTPSGDLSMTAAGPRDWDAATYDRVAAPQESWARELLDRLPLEGDESVLDAGCGSGRATRLLLERLPRGRVIGVDASRSMIEV